ncbi:hypothetical protein CFIO01_08879 [Colletotrichum fioriniae PJ7]|uniref:Integral membrane protein n=1 Tax=Colletotrichum fioriniae PJ7 TaxID=1445577 RepID=A0A010QDP4_9PEZI|nr:hypothetical protein CFIO01_08879 [Colletotrichum fioriniae PJ7]
MDVNGPSAATVIGTEFTLIGIAAALIGARIYLRLIIQDLPLITSDILACIAWVFTVASASYDIVFHKMGVLRSHVAYTLEGYDGTPEDVELVWKLQWSGQFPFFTAFYLCKATLLSLYARFFPVFMEIRRKILWGTMATSRKLVSRSGSSMFPDSVRSSFPNRVGAELCCRSDDILSSILSIVPIAAPKKR